MDWSVGFVSVGVGYEGRGGRARCVRKAVETIDVAILGASGYTGAELLRMLAVHPNAKIAAMTADRSAGKPIGEVFPQYGFGSQFARSLPDLVKVAEVEDWSKYDLIFCCLPHATTQEIISGIPLEKTKVVDLSADFRLSNIDTYTAWYGEHKAPNLQKEAVYGLVEHKRDEVRDARLVANPGCYPTAAQLALIPLLKNKSISSSDIIIDAKSGATGAGRSAKVGTLFCEVSDGMHAYGIAQHRHAPEIEQGLSEVTGEDVLVNFTPHLIPMNRGILETIFVKTSESPGALRQQLVEAYEDEPFVHILPEGVSPHTRHVRGSNHCVMNVFPDRLPGRAIIVSVIDNVVKGASGQAIQNMNVMMGFDETMGLEGQPFFP
uniref:N-acetyl-gamma-glutamyl-phosphate reductase n=1 Tax=Rhodosorus marinus TaxID=101924 RepID=A0A7S2ZLA1_9RHOD|mmetsp:Transcript_20999/g.85643  ORF Transcript_20999/g.85643 Transcript_20999/m.85643 type:complete len:378 (+) Transcript_20999:370-1503(+)